MEDGHVDARQRQQHELDLEGGVLDVGWRARREHAEAGDRGHDEGRPGPGEQLARHLADRVTERGEAEQPQATVRIEPITRAIPIT